MSYLRNVCLTEGRCFDCLRLIHVEDDDAQVCIECGGMNRLWGVRKPALWRRMVRAFTDWRTGDSADSTP